MFISLVTMAASSCDLEMLKNYNSRDLWGHLLLGDLEFLRMMNSCRIVYSPDYSRPCIKCGGTMNFRDKSGNCHFSARRRPVVRNGDILSELFSKTPI